MFMKKLFRTILLGVLATMALGTGASAETGGHFVSGSEHTMIKGEDLAVEPPTFTAFGQTIGCSEVSYSATVSSATKTVTEITVTPTFHKCSVKSLGFPAHIDMKGCDFVFTIGKVINFVQTFHLVCPTSVGPIITSTPGGSEHCTLEIEPNQTPFNGLRYTNVADAGLPHHLGVHFQVSSLVFIKRTGGFFQCGTFSFSDLTGKFGGRATFKAFDTVGTQASFTAT